MLIEIHLLQNHSPGNPNRDDVGAPKSAYFGGRLRGRISSQCIKRSIRMFPAFKEALAGHLGERTKLFPELVRGQLNKSKIPTEEHERIVLACTRIAKKEKETGKQEKEMADGKKRTPQLIYLDPGHVEEFVKRLERLKLREEMRAYYDRYLDPVAGFQEVMEAALQDSGLPEDIQDKVTQYAWVIAKSRMGMLSKTASEDEAQPLPEQATDQDPGERQAEWIVQRLLSLYQSDDAEDKKRLKEVCKKPSKDESKLVKPKLSKTEQKKYAEFKDQLSVPFRFNTVDIALFGRMTTSDAFEDVEACLEVAHAMSTNEMVREVDYYTAVDDLGIGAAAAHLGDNQFTSCTYYKYFSLDWKAFTDRLAGPDPTPAARKSAAQLARKALRALIHAAVHAIPTGKKKGHAHNNLPEAVLVEVKEKRIPTSYANAFLKPVTPPADSNLLAESVRQLGHYVGLVSNGYGLKPQRFWFDLHQEPLAITRKGGENQPPKTETLAESLPSFEALLDAVDKALAGAGGKA